MASQQTLFRLLYGLTNLSGEGRQSDGSMIYNLHRD